MPHEVRYDDFLQEVGIRYDRVHYADVVAAAQEEGPRVRVRAADAFHILRPYITPRFADQFKSVVPLALYLVAFQFLFLRQPVTGGWTVTLALLGVIVGLMLFMEGLRLGLMPLGERIGGTLPTHSPLPVVLAVVFLLGIGVTLAEPAIGALQAAGSIVVPEQAPLLYTLLTEKSGWLVAVVGTGVGIAAVIGTLRFVREWSLKPLILLVLAVIVRKRIPHAGAVALGVALTLVGMMVFNLGLTYGLAALGSQAGGALPAAFTQLRTVPGSPFYAYALGLTAVVLFAWFLGFGATLAEPALNALGLTVEDLTNGAFPEKLLMVAVAVGVAVGIALGVLKLVYALDLALFLIPGYLALLVLTFFSTEEYVNVAWDSAGVTTGPVTVPLVLAMGLGLGDAVRAPEGFGVLALASLCPIASVLLCGLYVRWRTGRAHAP